MNAAAYDSLDDALDLLSVYGPDLSNGLTSHAPMAAEALCAVGRPEVVRPWIDRYRPGMLPWPPPVQRITAETWPKALAQSDRVTDWRHFFAEELQAAPWRVVLDRWVGRLAPGICASATHGVIRTGHAARSLANSESPLRRQELADALASWAYAYQELPTTHRKGLPALAPREALARVAVVPKDRRRFSGTITSSLDALSEFPDFASVIGLLDVSGDARQLIAALTEVFARVYLANAHDVLSTIVFVHGVTSVAALGNLLPHLEGATARTALQFAWQAGCGLYAAFADHPMHAGTIDPPREDADTLVDMAIAHGDEHAIKFTEVCLHYDALTPSPAYRAAVVSALRLLPRA